MSDSILCRWSAGCSEPAMTHLDSDYCAKHSRAAYTGSQPAPDAADLTRARREGYEAAREQAAKVAEDETNNWDPNAADVFVCSSYIAKAILAMQPEEK